LNGTPVDDASVKEDSDESVAGSPIKASPFKRAAKASNVSAKPGDARAPLPDHRAYLPATNSRTQETVPLSPVEPPEDSATVFFFRNFILLPQDSGSMRGYLEYLIPMYNSASPGSIVRLATHAVACAGLANHPTKAGLRIHASKNYGRALKQIGTRLQSPELAKSDETLMATLLLSLYEVGATAASVVAEYEEHFTFGRF